MSRAVIAWCLYDLANTIFAMNMTSYHFPVWIIVDRGATELAYSVAFGFSMLASAAAMPWFGRHTDRRGGRILMLTGWTVGCVMFTGLLGFVRPVWIVLGIFALANFCYQLAGVFYNALLPAVSSKAQMGRISGYGVALGYVGTLIGIVAVAPFVERWGRQAAFAPTALLFLVLAVPSFFWVPEPSTKSSSDSAVDAAKIGKTLKPLLLPATLGLSVMGVAILFMSVYAKQAIGLSDAQLQRLLILSTAVAVVGTVLWGWITDRVGGFRALEWALILWTVTFGLACIGFSPALFTVVACLSGVALGGTWVTSRVLLVEWVGPHRLGEAFGLFGLVSRISSVAGPVVWALVLWFARPLGHERYRLAMGFLFLTTLISWRLYRRIKQ